MNSEVAQLRQQLADEYLAAKNGISGLALGTSRHQFISQKMENIGKYQEQLEAIVGHQLAMQMVTETLQPL